MASLFLNGCGSDEDEIVSQAKEDFNVLYTYEEDKIRPVLDEEKTPEELAKEYLKGSLGIENGEPKFAERGVVEDQGVFVESGIYEGGTIPNVAALSKEDKELINKGQEDVFAKEKAEEYDELSKERQEIIDSQYAKDNTEQDRIEEEIKRQASEIKQDKGNLKSNDGIKNKGDIDKSEVEFEEE